MKRILLLSMAAVLLLSVNTLWGQGTSKKSAEVKTIYLTKADFLTKVANYEKNPTEWKYLGDRPCIIDFYAVWCGPCKRLAPVLEQLAAEYDGKIYIYKVDAEKERDISTAFAVSSYPSLLFVPMDGSPQMAVGALPKEDLKKAIEEVLLPKK